MTSRQRVIGMGLLWLVCVWAVALVSPRIVPWMTGTNPWTWDVVRRVTPLTRWDSGWYVNLAEAGYWEPPTRVGQETNHAFFPLYPGLMRGLVRTTGIETSLAGNFVSAAAFLAALLLFAAWTKRHFGEERVLPAVLVLLAFPTSFFFATVYTEALALALALAAVLFFERGRPLAGAAAGVLAGLTRITGLVLAPYLALVAWRASREAGHSAGRAAARAAFAGASPLAGFGLFCLYFWRRFGDPLLFVKAQHNWSGQSKSIFDGPALIWQAVVEDVTRGRLLGGSPARTFEGLYLLLFLVLAAVLLAQKRRPEALYVVLTVAIVLASGTLESAGRYVLPAFPAFAALAGLSGRRGFFGALVALSSVAGALYVWAFVHWYWAG
ncbi:MAG TPA: mannosyltransferase family protein [Thermoanaerobaculia bacterium]